MFQLLVLNDNPKLKNEVVAKFNSGEVDLFRFVNFCSNHLVLPIIYFRLNETGLIKLFPSDLTEHLNDIHNLNIERNENILLIRRNKLCTGIR